MFSRTDRTCGAPGHVRNNDELALQITSQRITLTIHDDDADLIGKISDGLFR